MRRPAAAEGVSWLGACGSAHPFVILSGGGEAAGVEGPHRLRRPAAAEGVSWSGGVRHFPGAPIGRASFVILSGGGASRRSRRTSLAAKACSGGGHILVGRRAAPPRCADPDEKRLRPAENRQSRADGHICPSAQLLMVRAPASSPYETSTNRRGKWIGALSPLRRVLGLRVALDLRRLVQVSCGWLRAATASDLRTPRPAGAPLPAVRGQKIRFVRVEASRFRPFAFALRSRPM